MMIELDLWHGTIYLVVFHLHLVLCSVALVSAMCTAPWGSIYWEHIEGQWWHTRLLRYSTLLNSTVLSDRALFAFMSSFVRATCLCMESSLCLCVLKHSSIYARKHYVCVHIVVYSDIISSTYSTGGCQRT